MGFRLEDLHVHSHLSSCCMDERMTPNAILAFAEAHDYASLCLTDHLWDRAVPGASGWYAPQDIDHVRSSLPLPKSEKLPFYFGCETELPANGIPALAREHFELFDFVVIPPNHMHMKGLVRPEDVDTPKKMADCVTDRLENLLNLDLPFEKIGIAHLTGHLMFAEGSVADVIREMDSKRLERIFRGYAEAGAGIELNASSFPEWETRSEDLLSIYRVAKEAGCKFYACSDAHAIEQLNVVPNLIPEIAKRLGLTEDDQYRIPKK